MGLNLRQNPLAGVLIAAALIAVAVVITMRSGSAADAPRQAWFYDVQTGQLFAAAASEIPPVDAPSGPGNGVAAFVFGCGSCNEADRFINHLLTYTEKARQTMAQLDTHDMTTQVDLIDAGTRVAPPPDEPGAEPQWIPKTSPQGADLIDAAPSRCTGAKVQRCVP